jgi:hypothetical protein
MPMQRERYPGDWGAIALQIKTEVNWKCEQCDRECRRVGETLQHFIDRVAAKYNPSEITQKPNRFLLTVAHLNHIPEDCRRENLKALCSGCHCRYDLRAMGLKKRLKREYHGQLRLFDL